MDSPNALFCQSLPILDRAQQVNLIGISVSTKSQSRTLGRISNVMRSKLCDEERGIRLTPQTLRKDGVKDLPLGSTSNPLLLRDGSILVVNVYEQSSRSLTSSRIKLKSQNTSEAGRSSLSPCLIASFEAGRRGAPATCPPGSELPEAG